MQRFRALPAYLATEHARHEKRLHLPQELIKHWQAFGLVPEQKPQVKRAVDALVNRLANELIQIEEMPDRRRERNLRGIIAPHLRVMMRNLPEERPVFFTP